MYCALCEGVGALHAMEGGSHTDLTDLTDRADVKSAKGVEIYNCCFEPAYTIQYIVEAMKKVTGLTQFVPDIPNWVICLSGALRKRLRAGISQIL